jgi:hypothetical protein
MLRKSSILAVLFMAAMVIALLGTTANASADEGGEFPLPRVVIFVTSQNLYYDSIVTAKSVPNKGRFQLLVAGENGLETEFGPGDVGYLGGRWKMADGNGGFVYFVCPLLGPGRESPESP